MTALVREDDNKAHLELIRRTLGCDDKVPETELLMAKAYCEARGLDVMKKPLAIIPFKGKYQIFPTIEAIKTTASRANWAGTEQVVFSDKEIMMEWTDNYGKAYKTVTPEWGYVVVYKVVGGVRCAFTGPQVYFKERNQKNSSWGSQPMAMFNKCILAAALRNAFPEETAGMYIEEEAQTYQPVVNVDRSGVEALTKKVDDSSQEEILEAEEVPVDTYDDMLSLIMEASTEAELKQAGEAIKSFGEMPDHIRTNLLEVFNNKKKELK